jgi:hypothetical protein
LDALRSAPFCGSIPTHLNGIQLKTAAFSAEQALPTDIGVESAISGPVNNC